MFYIRNIFKYCKTAGSLVGTQVLLQEASLQPFRQPLALHASQQAFRRLSLILILKTPVVAAFFMAVVATLSVLLRKQKQEDKRGFFDFKTSAFSANVFMLTLCQVLLFTPVCCGPSNSQWCEAGSW